MKALINEEVEVKLEDFEEKVRLMITDSQERQSMMNDSMMEDKEDTMSRIKDLEASVDKVSDEVKEVH